LGTPHRGSNWIRSAVALVFALTLLAATVVEAAAAPKMKCADASWDCTVTTQGNNGNGHNK
jgi:hypothetical protein